MQAAAATDKLKQFVCIDGIYKFPLFAVFAAGLLQGSCADGGGWRPDHGAIGQPAHLEQMHQATQQQQQQQPVGLQVVQQGASRQVHLAHMQQLHHAAMQVPALEQQQALRVSQPLPIQVQQAQMAAEHQEAVARTGRKQPAAAAPASSDMNWESPDAAGHSPHCYHCLCVYEGGSEGGEGETLSQASCSWHQRPCRIWIVTGSVLANIRICFVHKRLTITKCLSGSKDTWQPRAFAYASYHMRLGRLAQEE